MTDWQPIETAPKDGTVIVVYANDIALMKWWDGSEYGADSFWSHAEEVMADVDPTPEQPTMWTPLEPPPSKA